MTPRRPSGTFPVKTPRIQAHERQHLGDDVEDVQDDEVRDRKDDVADDSPACDLLRRVKGERGGGIRRRDFCAHGWVLTGCG